MFATYYLIILFFYNIERYKESNALWVGESNGKHQGNLGLKLRLFGNLLKYNLLLITGIFKELCTEKTFR